MARSHSSAALVDIARMEVACALQGRDLDLLHGLMSRDSEYVGALVFSPAGMVASRTIWDTQIDSVTQRALDGFSNGLRGGIRTVGSSIEINRHAYDLKRPFLRPLGRRVLSLTYEHGYKDYDESFVVRTDSSAQLFPKLRLEAVASEPARAQELKVQAGGLVKLVLQDWLPANPAR